MSQAELYYMEGISKGINCLRLRFSKFITIYTFCRLALGDGTTNLESWSWKPTASSSHNTSHQRAAKAELEELQQMKELVQQLLQSNEQMWHMYEAMLYMMRQVIISTSTICQIPVVIETEDLVINE
jgi:hypothetical protein